MFNIALLGKWKWRLITDNNCVWSDFLHRLYGNGGLLKRNQYSIWWRDIDELDNSLSYAPNWFSDAVKTKLGDGRKLKFWADQWCCPWRLMDLFPQLYLVSSNQNGSVAEYGYWSDGF